jgi:2-oxoglutarate ferredoxin oxidoreductase subunit beta
MKQVFGRTKSLKNAAFHYCPGCGHSIIHRLIAEVIDELNIKEKVIGIPPAGCAVLAYDYFDIDMGEAPHGRGAAVAAANRGEKITTIFVNNGVYGMTGGQMAPTTIVGQISTTTPGGRNPGRDGMPIDLSEMLALTNGSVYIERTSVDSPKNIIKTKKAIKKAFQVQLAGLGFSLVEVLSPCPTNLKMSPVQASKWIGSTMTTQFPLKVIKDEAGNLGAPPPSE